MTTSITKLQFLGLGLLLGTCFLHGSLAQPSNIDPATQKLIDDFVQDWYLPNSEISKMGLSIVRNNGEVLYGTGYGLADQDRGIPNGNLTQFLIGSTSKSFTATVVVKVLHELYPNMGEAVLDTPIRKLLPSQNFTLIDRFRSEHTTFRDLLAHRVCIFRDDLQLLADPFSSVEEIVYRQRYAEQICGIRTEFQYNNQMYVIAGELIGIIANKTYQELITNLFEDIGMHNSNLTRSSDDFSNMPYRGQPYYVMNNASHPYNTSLVKRVARSVAAGGLFIPPNDMVRYMRFHLNKGSIDGKQIVPENVLSWLTKPTNSMPTSFYKSSDDDLVVSTFGYGLGLMLASYDGWQYIHHGGYFPPYHTLMSLFPSQKLGIFTSTNEGVSKVDALALHAFIFEVLKGTSADKATEKAAQLWARSKKNKIMKEMKKEASLKAFIDKAMAENVRLQTADDIIGKYGSGGSGDVEISEKFNNQTNTTQLYVHYGDWYKGWLENIAGSLYQITWDSDIIHDSYAGGDSSGTGYAFLRVQDGILEFLGAAGDDFVVMGKFKLGVSLDNLPPIPWAPDSCGPEV